jgi:hypothetical protein
MMKQILPLDPAGYRRHPLHSGDRIWAETNCYTDIWIELLHTWGHEPLAALPFTLAIDFEGDQWTFFKFLPADLYDLYGLDVQELAVWRPLTTHIDEQVGLGRPVLVELDSYYLPDTAGAAYQREHVKSTVAVNAIDVANKCLGYFHNQAYHELRGHDFIEVFRLHESEKPDILPPYVEFVKPRKGARSGKDLVAASSRLLCRELGRLPTTNPFEKFKARFRADLDWLVSESIETFHRYSFATMRQFGAAYQLAAAYLQWLDERMGTRFTGPIEAFASLANTAKTLQFHLARAMARQKAMDLSPFDVMASTWHSAVERLKFRF